MLKKTLVALALIGATVSANAATTVISENFDNVPALTGAGWRVTDNSTPAGTTGGWFQGQTDPLGASAYSGAPTSFIAANYNAAAPGGQLMDYLITPVFDTSGGVTVTLFARAAGEADLSGLFDQLAFGFSSGVSADVSTFTFSAPVTISTDDWTKYTFSSLGNGPGTQGRFAILYTGAADNANYVGVDSLTVTVPEPATVMTFGIGMLGLLALRRRKQS